MKTIKHSVIPDASVLVEKWERAAAEREQNPVKVREDLSMSWGERGLFLILASASVGLVAYFAGILVRWLCGC